MRCINSIGFLMQLERKIHNKNFINISKLFGRKYHLILFEYGSSGDSNVQIGILSSP